MSENEEKKPSKEDLEKLALDRLKGLGSWPIPTLKGKVNENGDYEFWEEIE